MKISQTGKRVTVRTAKDLSRVLGLSSADAAGIEFRSELTVALAKIIQAERSPMPKSPGAPERQERE